MKLKRLRHMAEFAAFLVVGFPLALIPLPLSRRIGASLGLVGHALFRRRREVALGNVRAAKACGALPPDPPAEAVVREHFRSLGRWGAELLKVYFGMGRPLVESIRVEGIEHFHAAQAAGKGIVVVSGHAGNWELLGLAISAKLGRVIGVARRQSNPYLDRFIVRTRERFGSHVIYKEGALRAFLSELKSGGTVGVYMDQHASPSQGLAVEFLGRPAWSIRMPALLGRRTGAALLPVFLHETPTGHVMRIYPVPALTGDEQTDMRRMLMVLEEYIREHQSHWLWIHRRWKETGFAEETLKR